MESLRFDTGIKEFALNGNENAIIRINPTDANQLKQLYDTLTKLNDKQEEYEKRLDEAGDDTEKVFQVLDEMDRGMRSTLDSVFGIDFCKNAFGYINLYAYGDGLPIWFNFLEAVLDMFDKKLRDVEKERSPRVEKYINKYRK